MTGRGLQICVFNDSKEKAAFLIRRWCEIAEEAISCRGFFAAALSGGTAPAEFYGRLAELRGNFQWDKTHIFLVDERFVPRGNGDSNLGLMEDLFMRAINIPSGNVHAVVTDNISVSGAAELYAKELKQFFALSGHELPDFDFVGLGIGLDGHTASLFPGKPRLVEYERMVITSERAGIKHTRISLTLPVINHARNVLFIAAGKEKAGIIRRIVEDKDRSLPAAAVMPEKGELTFVLDVEAASSIGKESETVSVYCK
jgi:6-phosphogluconolactonase